MGLDITRIQAICFDIDGSLIDTDDAYIERLAGWLARLGRLLRGSDPQHLARRLVMAAESPINTLVTWMDWLHLDQILGPGMDALHRLRGVSPPARARLIPGARSALERLARHYPLAVVTAREQSSALDILRSHALAKSTLHALPQREALVEPSLTLAPSCGPRRNWDVQPTPCSWLAIPPLISFQDDGREPRQPGCFAVSAAKRN